MPLKSFIDVPRESPFPIQNLPFGVFKPRDSAARVGVAIGEHIVDLPFSKKKAISILHKIDNCFCKIRSTHFSRSGGLPGAKRAKYYSIFFPPIRQYCAMMPRCVSAFFIDNGT